MMMVSAIFAQTMAGAAGLTLGPDGRLLDRGEPVLEIKITEGRVTVDAHYAVLAWIATHVPDRAALAIRHGQALDVDRMGTLGLAFKAAPDLRGSCQRLARYSKLLSDTLRYQVEEQTGGTLLRYEYRAATGPGAVLSPEAGLAGLVHAMRQVSHAVAVPDRVTFRHQPPRDAAAFEDYYQCEVVFGADQDGLLLSDAALDAPNRIGDKALSDFLMQHLEAEHAARRPHETLAERVLKGISARLTEGVPKAGDVAAQLGMSERTFHRRLSDDGESYRALCDRTRKTLAHNLLRDTQQSLAEIAFVTGFSEQSAFTRAFKRWHGQTPAEFRNAVTSAR